MIERIKNIVLLCMNLQNNCLYKSSKIGKIKNMVDYIGVLEKMKNVIITHF